MLINEATLIKQIFRFTLLYLTIIFKTATVGCLWALCAAFECFDKSFFIYPILHVPTTSARWFAKDAGMPERFQQNQIVKVFL